MELKIKTARMKEEVANAFKGSGKISNLRITEAIGIEAKEGNVIFTTTDNATNLTVRILDAVDKNIEFYACTDSETLAKLVSKTDSEYITLTLKEGYLQFEGNGVYNLPLILEPEDGSLCRISQIPVSKNNEFVITKKDADKLLQYNKFSVSKTISVPFLMGYCLKNGKGYTYNSESSTATISTLDIDKEISALVPQTIINLLSNIKDEKFKMYVDENKISFESSNIRIDGTLMEDMEKFPVDQLESTFDIENIFTNSVKVNKTELINTLDRIGLFVESDDSGSIGLSFTNEGLLITNKKSSGVEKIDYSDKNLNGVITKQVDIKDLRGALGTITGEVVLIRFGEAIGLEIEENGAGHIVAQMDDEEDSEELEQAE